MAWLPLCAASYLSVAALVAAGCSFDPGGGARPADAGSGDGPVTADGAGGDGTAGDAAPLCESWQPLHFDPCALTFGDAIDLTGGKYLYDTETGVLAGPSGDSMPPSVVLPQPDGPDVRVIAVEGFAIAGDAELRAVGSSPLLVASLGELSIAGLLDVSTDGENAGAGANPGECASHAATDGGNSTSGAGGGGGGGFGERGERGGTGGSSGQGTRGERGESVDPPALIRGGCAGGRGGAGDNPTLALAGGGGGAVQLSARVSITIGGRIHAGGGGGAGAVSDGGGGGGGSGGYIGLDAPAIEISAGAILAANGGGGGQGANTGTGGPGQPALLAAEAAAGGSGGSGGAGNGGAGGFAGDGAVTGSSNSDGAGGGGGGVGFILIREAGAAIDGAAIVSPDPELL